MGNLQEKETSLAGITYVHHCVETLRALLKEFETLYFGHSHRK